MFSIQKGIQLFNTVGCSSKNFQQLMYDRLSDRDYDGFTLQEHVYLKDKIGFTIFGPPQNVNGYDDMQKKKIEETYKKICEQSSKFYNIIFRQ